MNFKDKINKIDAESKTTDEIFAEWGTTEAKYLESALKQVKKQLFLAKAAAGRERNARLIERFKEVFNGGYQQSENLRVIINERMPAFQFRNLDKLSDEQISQILLDETVMQLLEKEDERK